MQFAAAQIPGSYRRSVMSRSRSDKQEYVDVQLHGRALLRDPALNKGTNFSPEERKTLGIEGLLPFQSKSIDQQADRVYAQLCRYSDSLDKHIALAALRERNQTLFYRVLTDHCGLPRICRDGSSRYCGMP